MDAERDSLLTTFSIRSSAIAALGLLILGAWLPAQPGPGRLVVISDLGSPVRTGLLEIDTATGTLTPLGTFVAATLEPLAVASDPVNRNLVVALQDAGPVSRIIRLRFQGTAVLEERELGVIPGIATGLECATGPDTIRVAVDGPGGGLWRVPRHGGTPILETPLPYVTTFDIPFPGFGFAVQSLPVGDPILNTIDFATGAITSYPIPGLAGRRITGVHDMPTGAVRQGLSDDMGGLHRFEFFTGVVPWLSTPLPAGASVALEPDGTGWSYLVLGGAASPFLRSVPMLGTTATTVLGPLTGAPRGMTLTAAAAATYWSWGSSSCGTAPSQISWGGAFTSGGGYPAIGASISITLSNGAPGAPAVLAFGGNDLSWGATPLPLTIPGGCQLLVSPDTTLTTTADSTGGAAFSFSIPADPTLAGLILFGQWGQPTPTGWLTSDGLAAHIW